MENPKTNRSGSLSESLGLRSPEDLTMKGEERVLSVIARELDRLKQEVYDIKTEQIKREFPLPPEILAQLGLPPRPPEKLKRGRGYRPLLMGEIKEANEHSKNMAMAARYLGVCYATFKKYAIMYNLWVPQPYVKGKKGVFDPERGRYPLSDILQGKYPEYPIFKVKDKLIRSGVKELKCELCGYHEKRVTDGKLPLILNFMDGNEKNHVLENMKLYCYNCTFTCGRGYIRSGNHYFDPDWLQGGEKDDAQEGARY